MNQNRQKPDKMAQQRTKMGQDRDRMEQNKRRSRQQQAEEGQGRQQQGGWGPVQDNEQGDMGRKPGAERDRDYDPDGDRMGEKS